MVFLMSQISHLKTSDLTVIQEHFINHVMNKISQSLPLVLFLFSTLFLLTDCRTDPKVDEATEVVEYKRTVNEVSLAPLKEPNSLNPIITTDNVALNTLGYLFQTLQSIDPTDLSLTPILAKAAPEVEEIDNGIAYTFELREDAVWPNGTAITAKDVEFTLKAILNPKIPSPYRGVVNVYSDLTIDENNPRRFTISMKEKNIRSEEVASNSFFVLPAYHYDAQNLLADIPVRDLIDPAKAEQLANTNPNLQAFADEFMKPKYAREVDGVIGSGAYELNEWVTGQRVTMVKKENWWGDAVENNVYYGNNVDKITLQPIGDANVVVAAMQNEDIDVLDGMSPETFKTLKADENVSKAYDFFTAPRYVTGFWYINNQNSKLSDKRVRRALAHVVDVDAIINDVLDIPLERISTPILSTMPGYDPNLKPIEFDVEKAKALLNDAGWEDSNNNGIVDKMISGELVELSLTVATASVRATQEQAAELVKEDAIQAGIEIEILKKDPKVNIGELNTGDYELTLGAILEPTPWAYDPYQFWHTASVPPNGINRMRFGNAETDALIEEIRTTMDAEKRNELYKKFQQVIYEEQPIIFLYEQPNFLAIHKRFNTKAFAYSPNYFIGDFDMNRK